MIEYERSQRLFLRMKGGEPSSPSNKRNATCSSDIETPFVFRAAAADPSVNSTVGYRSSKSAVD
jgi:hypothetical protein